MLAVSFSPDESRLAAAGADNAVRVFDVASGRQELLIQQHADWVMAVAWSGDGTRLASASRDRTARIYDAKSGELLVSFQEHGAPVQAVAFGAGANDVFTGGRDKRLRVWNAADEAKQVAAVEGFADELIALQTGGGGIFTASADGHVREHSLSDRKLLRDLPDLHDRVESLAWNAATRRIAAGAHDGTVCVWEAGQAQPLVRFIAAPGAAPRAPIADGQ
jgi:WD40 repeat protein